MANSKTKYSSLPACTVDPPPPAFSKNFCKILNIEHKKCEWSGLDSFYIIGAWEEHWQEQKFFFWLQVGLTCGLKEM